MGIFKRLFGKSNDAAEPTQIEPKPAQKAASPPNLQDNDCRGNRVKSIY